MYKIGNFLVGLASLGLTACVSLPNGPSVMVLPGAGKSFEQFRADDVNCRQYAKVQIGGEVPAQYAQNSALGSAALGTAVGAGVGAAVGAGKGAAIGEGSGLVLGSAVGSSYAGSSYYEAQQYFDMAYIQCMYAQGHRVPVSGQISTQGAAVARTNATIPPPPPGNPPPPPLK